MRGYEQKFAWACVERLKTLWGPLVVTLALCSSSKRRKRTPLGLTDPLLMAKDLGGSASISRRISRLVRNTIFGLVSREEYRVWGNNCVSVSRWKIESLEINRASLYIKLREGNGPLAIDVFAACHTTLFTTAARNLNDVYGPRYALVKRKITLRSSENFQKSTMRNA